jgi:hypothetical protein
MLIIGLILFAAALAVGIDVAAMNDLGIDIDAFGQVYETNTGALFVAGFVTALVACLGLVLISDGLARSVRRRAERRRIKAERDQLAEEAEKARAARVEAEAERDRALVDEPQLDLRDQPGERVVTSEGVAAEEKVERPRHRLLHRSGRE